MDEVIKLVSQKAGISEAQARQAVSVVVDFLKQRLPAPIASQIESVVAGGSLPDVSKGLGGLFGGK